MNHYAPFAAGLLAPLDHWLKDATVSEILVNQPGEVWIEKAGQLTAHPVPEFNVAHLNRLFQLIANENQQHLSIAHPLLSGSLFDGSRVQLCLPPTAKYHALAIRRQVANSMTLDDYAKTDFYQHAYAAHEFPRLNTQSELLLQAYKKANWDAFIRYAINFKKNIVISGGTSSGKTTFLNACLQHISPAERIIVLEDTREIHLPHRNQVQLLANKGEQGEAHVTMQDLVQCSLRLRPDRIIMGEIRGKEIMDFISACSTGHAGSLTSIHANNPHMAFMRMAQMYKLNHVPAMSDDDILRELKNAIDIIIHIEKVQGQRRMSSVFLSH